MEALKILVQRAAGRSTCLKRVTVCVLLDPQGKILAVESNRCSPPKGRCCRLGCHEDQAAYPLDSECGWKHAETRAIEALAPEDDPLTAIVYGHEFVCPACKARLRARGVGEIIVVPEHAGTGLR